MKNFTFGILTYNQEKYILQTLESIKFQKIQYGADIDVSLIITDDASKDRTVEILRTWIAKNRELFDQIDLIANEKNKGTVANFKTILSKVSAEHLKIIAGDDLIGHKNVFAEYCPDWTDEQFTEAEVLVSGIEYATLMTTETSSPLDMRISGALDAIMKIYNVPDDIRQKKISKVLSMDYKNLGRRIFKEFKQYINDVNEQAFEELFA